MVALCHTFATDIFTSITMAPFRGGQQGAIVNNGGNFLTSERFHFRSRGRYSARSPQGVNKQRWRMTPLLTAHNHDNECTKTSLRMANDLIIICVDWKTKKHRYMVHNETVLYGKIDSVTIVTCKRTPSL